MDTQSVCSVLVQDQLKRTVPVVIGSMFLSATKNLWPTALVHGQRSFRIHAPEFMLCHCGKFIWSIYPLVARGIFKDNDSVVPGHVAEV